MKKHCRSKAKFPTKTIKGSGNLRGSNRVGSEDALADIKRKYLGLKVVRTNHNKFQWVFYMEKET